MAYCCYRSPDVCIYRDNIYSDAGRAPLWIASLVSVEFEELEDLRAYLKLVRKGGVYLPEETLDRVFRELQEDAV